MSLKPGDTVTIYEHPLEETDPEGQAKLVKRLGELGHHEGRVIGHWMVDFTEEDGSVLRTDRTVLEPRKAENIQ